MLEVLQIPEADVVPLRRHFRKDFGTTFLGLKSMIEVDEMDYLNFVHDIDLNDYLTDDGSLYDMLSTIPQRKIIFTNSDKRHSERVLDFFHVLPLFDLIIDVIALKPYVKPHPEAYDKALAYSGLNTPQGCLFIDDLLENVSQGAASGFTSILIGDENPEFMTISDIFELPALLNSLNGLKE